MATYYVTDTTPGAPALTGQNNSLVDVLDFGLVTTAGLTKAYSGTNKAVYTLPNGHAMRVVHDSSVSGQAQFAVVRCAESASGIDTITDAYPTTALVADNACNWHTSITANSTARPYFLLVDTVQDVIIFIACIDNAAYANFIGVWCGSEQSTTAGDTYGAFLTVRNNSGAHTAAGASDRDFWGTSAQSSPGTCVWWARSYDGTLKSPKGQLGPANHIANNGGPPLWVSGPTYPHPVDNKYWKNRVFAGDRNSTTNTNGTGVIPNRCYVPHLWLPMHRASSFGSLNIGDTFTDGAYDAQIGASATFVHIPFGSAAGAQGAIALEITDTSSMPPVSY